ncbi:hypothetical protein CHS0354_000880, partial [Potamilus streckersoni]
MSHNRSRLVDSSYPEVRLGSSCILKDACAGAICNGGRCTCESGYYDSNGVNTTGGLCIE